MTSPPRQVAYAGLAVSAAFAVAVAGSAPAGVRLPLVLAFVCLGPGAAVVAHARIADPAVRWAMAVLLSLAATVALGCATIWLDAWHPTAVGLGTAGLTAASSAAALIRGRRRPLQHRPGRRRPSAVALAHAGVLAAAAGLWAVALAGTDVARVGQYGLLATVHPAFFGALLLCCAGFLAEVVRGARRPGALVAYTVLLIMILHATTPLLLAKPQYAWTYKHVGVVDLVQQYGQVLDEGDLYQRWPGLFAATALVADLSGVGPLALAKFAPVLFNLVDAVVLLAIARTLSADRRVAALTVFGFLCVNWIEEDYLSPQALAYPLALGVLLVTLRWLRHLPAQPRGRGRKTLPGWLRAGAEPPPPVSRATRVAALAALTVLDAALTATHQLSPYLVAAQLLALAALGLLRPWWTGLAALAIPALFLIPRYSLVAGSFDIFESLDFFGNAGGNADGWGTHGQAFSAIVVRALAIGIWAATTLIVIRAARRRDLGSVLAPAVLAYAPFMLLFAQSYGGEAIYRVYLFSAPWCAYLIARAAVRTADRWHPAPGRLRTATAAGTLTLCLLALATVQGRHGQLMVDRQTTAEVSAAEYLYAHAEPGGVIALAAPNFPSRVSARYRELNRSVPVGEPDLVKGADLAHVRLDQTYLPRIEQFLGSFHGTTTYLVISDGMRRYAQYFGALPDGSLDTLDRTLADSPQWSVFYRDGGVTIYQRDGTVR